MRDEPLVARAAPLACAVGEGCHEWAVDEQVSELERCADGGLGSPGENFEGVAGVNDGVYAACLEAAEESCQPDRLGEVR